MSLFVKICGLSTAADVAAAVAAGADAIGFVFADSVRRVTPRDALAAAREAPADVVRVAVMRHPVPAEWQQVLAEFAPDALQTDAADFAALALPASVAAWPVYREGGPEAPQTFPGPWLYEGAVSGSGAAVDWSKAAGLAARGNMLLAGGLTPANVARAVGTVRPWGVDVSSGVESAPGRKDPRLIATFLEAAHAAETTA